MFDLISLSSIYILFDIRLAYFVVLHQVLHHCRQCKKKKKKNWGEIEGFSGAESTRLTSSGVAAPQPAKRLADRPLDRAVSRLLRFAGQCDQMDKIPPPEADDIKTDIGFAPIPIHFGGFKLIEEEEEEEEEEEGQEEGRGGLINLRNTVRDIGHSAIQTFINPFQPYPRHGFD